MAVFSGLICSCLVLTDWLHLLQDLVLTAKYLWAPFPQMAISGSHLLSWGETYARFVDH